MKKRSGIIATKIGNSSYYNDNGMMEHVTILKVEECIVANNKTIEKDGYLAVQLTSIEKNVDIKKINKPQQKFFTNLDIKPKKVIKEFRVDDENSIEIGQSINVNHFEKNQYVDVTGTTIGKGFAGAMKRHNFSGLRASHGVSISHRAHGSTGQNQDPGRVFKGKKMAGHMGAKKITKQNLRIVDIDKDNNLIILKGAVPGKKNSIVFLKDAVKKN